MFDEQNQPEDIFAEIDPAKDSAGSSSATRVSAPTDQQSSSNSVASRGPSKLLFIAIALVVVALIGGGVWYFYLRDTSADSELLNLTNEAPTNNQVTVPVEGTPPEPEPPVDSICGNTICEPGEEIICPSDCQLAASVLCGNGVCDNSETTIDCPADCPPTPTEPVIEPEPANQPLDSDNDGLSDEEERQRGTNPQSADTDSDGLSDREEVFLYNTDPTKPDTDDDGYIDGEEVKAGYNPNGEGKLLNLPQ
ncbi:hypothetical protein KKF05_05535 [Patescibacteria group bacterium]|nr:hypothetical protein [Patescibacteria group bacterium]MBU1028664.1 hypothetical protein [Patescibacteria group bacterium]